MPQNQGGQKKKKKGHAPAHQNKFAYKHNPKSKTTAKILASPNVHVCRRCHDKIEWRKQYRKYKPRTQPGTCNGCKKRNVLAAYHTICESCTRNSVKAKELIEAELKGCTSDKINEGDSAETLVLKPKEPKLRACAMCVKEIALPDPEEEADVDLLAGVGRIRLRDRKALERMVERDAREAAAKKNGDRAENDDRGDTDLVQSEDVDPNTVDDVDPFLQAVGGADKLLTGKAYQESLLALQQS